MSQKMTPQRQKLEYFILHGFVVLFFLVFYMVGVRSYVFDSEMDTIEASINVFIMTILWSSSDYILLGGTKLGKLLFWFCLPIGIPVRIIRRVYLTLTT